MILADSSAWIEYLRRTESVADRRMDALLGEDAVAVTDVVLMEVLAGARDELDSIRLRRLLRRCEPFPTTPVDYEAAAQLHRACRAGGETVRKLTDCLIAAVAIRTGVRVLSADADFTVLSRHTALELA